MERKKSIAIVGAGPAALSLAAQLREDLFEVTLYERLAAPARKFLVAGDGGFNLTHSEDLEVFLSRYAPSSFLEKSLRFFSNQHLRDWLGQIGIETYVGSSKRVFPIKGTKPIQVLQAILKELERKHVKIKTSHYWKGWTLEQKLLFQQGSQELVVEADYVVFAMGGASWVKTGSDGAWANSFQQKGLSILPFQASNCALQVHWPPFLAAQEGKWIKNCAIRCEEVEKKGELVITKFGIEGGAIYALSPQIRNQLKSKGIATLFLDLKPSFSLAEVEKKCIPQGKKTISSVLKEELMLSEVQIALIKTHTGKEEFTSPSLLAQKIKHLPLIITATGPLDEAISTVGGLALDEVGEDFQLKKLPHHYALGEMLDWDAPTGGYLLQACFSMGAYLANILNSSN